MSSSQRDRTLSDSVELGTRQRVEYWFLRQGVPHFAQKYCYHERLLLLVLPMVILIAFELGVAEWSNLDTAQLFLVPPVVVALTAFSWPLISLPFERNPLRRLVSLRVALCVVV